MSLQATNLLIQMGKIPATFLGKPQDFADEMVRRMRILSPSGTNFIFIGDTEPTSNVGPWLKGGTQWYVWDDNIKRYVPLDISASETKWFHVGLTIPATSTPPVWLRTTKDQSESDPSIGDPIGWLIFDGTNWVPFNSVVQSGPTTARPTSPVDLQQFYDSTISVLIWWERGAWRTVSGVPGDIKVVGIAFLSDALAGNPGWELFGASNQAFRGRYVSQATKDLNGTDLTTSPNVAHRQSFETFGETDFVAINDSGFDSSTASPAITVTQALTMVTASAAVFNTTMVGQVLQFADGSPQVTITAYTSPTKVTVNLSQTVTPATTFVIPGSLVPYPPTIALWHLIKT